MPRNKLLVSALALALGGVTTAQAQTFSGVVVFGDSLSDAGNVAALQGLPVGNSFTTNPDPVYAELVAQAFGFSGINSLRPGGTNYARGGACARSNVTGGFTCINSPGSFSIANQFATHLSDPARAGQADPNALYMIWAGANDIFTAAATPATAQQNTGIAAATVVGQIGQLQALGANTIVVFNLPDLGLTPQNVGTAAQASASALSFVYNSTFNAGLANLGDGIVPINVFGLFNEIIASPSLYGFSNVTGRACQPQAAPGYTSLACGPVGSGLPFTYAAGTNSSFLFADGVHPTGAAHAMLANVVVATLSAPGQVSMVGELPLQVYDNHSNVINQQIFGMSRAPRSEGDANIYGQVQYSRNDFGATINTNEFDNDTLTGTFGADVRYNDAISLGASVTVGGSDGDSFGSSIKGTEVLLSAYGIAHFGSGYINAIATGGSARFDIERSIVLGPTTRVDEGNTSASHLAFELGGGFAFGSDDFRHGPFVSVTWQQVEVDGYTEDTVDSTSMYFGEFNRKSTVGRVGYQAQGTAGRLQPFGKVAWARESQDRIAAIQAGSNSMNGHFTLGGFVHAEDWMEADVGVNWAYSDATDITLIYRARLSDDTQDGHSIGLGFRTEFGGPAPAPAPEPVAVVETTCADLDDDGDGINNCNDKCPGSTAGEAVGADGCPVAVEPEPVMEPKPFRN